jgi:DNA ligase 1
MTTMEIITALRDTNSLNVKKTVLKEATGNDLFKKVCFYTYNSMMTYGITLDAINKFDKQSATSWTGDMFDLLDLLASRQLTGHSALAQAKSFIEHNKSVEIVDIFTSIIDRDLGIRLSSTVLNKEIFASSSDEWYIPEFEVALAQTYSKASGKNVADFTSKEWMITKKLDGARNITIVKDGSAKCYSREGNEFLTLTNVQTAIESFCKENNLDNVVFDGEICIVDENGQENFQSIMKEIKKKGHTIKNPMYILFDLITLDEFIAKESKDEYVARYNSLDSLINNSTASKFFKIVENYGIAESVEQIAELLTEVTSKGAEGLMIRTGKYEGKRTWNLQKVKSFYDAEYVVDSVETDVISFIKYVAEDGTEYLSKTDCPKNVSVKSVTEKQEMVARVNITHKGNKVGVGSGFSIAQRKEFFADPSKIIGKTILVAYFEETTNKEGTTSLRFPTVKFIYENGRDC